MRKFKIGYVVDDNGCLIGTETVYQEVRTGGYPHAENVILESPPEKTSENQCQRYVDGKWELVEDWRGYTIYDTDGKPVGVVSQIGAVVLADGQTIQIPPKFDSEKENLHWDGKSWIKQIKPEYIYDGDSIREKTVAEKVASGLIVLGPEEKLEGNAIVFKTLDELFEDGIISVDEYNKEIDNIRKNEYRKNTDAMGLMVLRGEITMEEWQAAINEIKQKFSKK